MKNVLFFCCWVCCLVLQAHVQPKVGKCATCHAAIFPLKEQTALQIAKQTLANRETKAANHIIDLLIAYDPQGLAVAENEGGVEKHAARILELSNEVFANSHIDASFRLVHTMEVPQTITSITDGIRYGLNAPLIQQARRTHKADIVVLCSEPLNDGQMGMAALEATRGSLALASVRASAATSTYTVIHEIGHIFGCQHSREATDAGTHEYAVGASRAPYFTVMGFPEQEGLEEQVPLFSGPESVWKGVVMGGEIENCVRKIRERLSVVSAFEQATGYRLSLSNWEIDNAAQEIAVDLTTDTFYFINSSAPWLTTSITEGVNSTRFWLRAQANPSSQARTATVTIEGNEEYGATVVTIRQEGGTTAIEKLHLTNEMRVENGCLYLSLPTATDLKCYDIQGRLLQREQLSAGEQQVFLKNQRTIWVKLTTQGKSETYTLRWRN